MSVSIVVPVSVSFSVIVSVWSPHCGARFDFVAHILQLELQGHPAYLGPRPTSVDDADLNLAIFFILKEGVIFV